MSQLSHEQVAAIDRLSISNTMGYTAALRGDMDEVERQHRIKEGIIKQLEALP